MGAARLGSPANNVACSAHRPVGARACSPAGLGPFSLPHTPLLILHTSPIPTSMFRPKKKRVRLLCTLVEGKYPSAQP